MNGFKYWLFDIDDTLIDFKTSMDVSLQNCHRLFFNAVEFSLFKSHYSEINHALWEQAEKGVVSIGKIGTLRFEELTKKLAIPFTSHIPEYYEQQLIENSRWIEGAVDLLEKLKAAGKKIGFLTNGFTHIQHGKFKNLELHRYSDVLVIAQEFGYSKPHRKIFDHILEKMGAHASKTLMVGDSLTSDGEGARNAGLAFCWYNPHGKSCQLDWEPTFSITDWNFFSVD